MTERFTIEERTQNDFTLYYVLEDGKEIAYFVPEYITHFNLNNIVKRMNELYAENQ